MLKVRKLKNEELGRPSLDDFREQAKLPLVLVLDNIRSMHNVGSAFRTADAFALEGIRLCGITGKPPHREIEKTALGATLSVNWEYHANIAGALDELKAGGYRLLAVEQTDSSLGLDEFRPAPGEKYALIFGNELHGVSEPALARADECLEIPQFGTKHSLNVAVSIGIVVWDFFLKRFKV